MSDPCIEGCLPCGLITPKRGNYFDGQPLVAKDFLDQQDYHRGSLYRHNAFLHGTGVVCGLKLVQHPAPDCQRIALKLTPGLALDCCGRDLIVPADRLVPVSQLIAADPDLGSRLDGTRHLMIGLRRCDRGTEALPMILPDCGPPGATEWTRIAEEVEFVLWAADPSEIAPLAIDARPALAWRSSFTFPAERPVALCVNEGRHWLQVTLQNAGGSGRLHLYDLTSHDLVAMLEGVTTIGDTAAARQDELLFAAGEKITSRTGTADHGVALWRASEAVADPKPAAVIATDHAQIRIATTPTTGELFVLEADPGKKARLSAYSPDALTDWLKSGPAPGTRPKAIATAVFDHDFGPADGPTGRGAAMMKVSADGRLLALAAPGIAPAQGLYLIEIAALHAGSLTGADDAISDKARPEGYEPPSDATERLVAVDFSLDANILYVLTGNDTAARVARFALTGAANRLARAGRGGMIAARPVDFAIGPTEAYGYLLAVDTGGLTRFTSFAIEPLKAPEATPLDVALTHDAVRLDGTAQAFAMEASGKRAHVMLADSDAEAPPDRGLVAVIDIAQADCAICLTRTLDGCASCAPDDTRHAVVLGHLPFYRHVPAKPEEGPRMLDLAAGTDTVGIDNATYRLIVPSAAALRDAVLCILAQGTTEGPPGPRGDPGKDGKDGKDGAPGKDGKDGKDGAPGKDGKDGTDGAPGTNGTNGTDGTSFRLTAIIATSWVDHQDYPDVDSMKFSTLLLEKGIALAFDGKFDLRPFIRRRGQPLIAELQLRKPDVLAGWLTVGRLRLAALVDPTLAGTLVTDFGSSLADEALKASPGLVLRLGDNIEANFFVDVDALRVVLYADMLVDHDGLPLDGHFIGGQLPTGKAAPGGIFTSWFTLAR